MPGKPPRFATLSVTHSSFLLSGPPPQVPSLFLANRTNLPPSLSLSSSLSQKRPTIFSLSLFSFKIKSFYTTSHLFSFLSLSLFSFFNLARALIICMLQPAFVYTTGLFLNYASPLVGSHSIRWNVPFMC